MSSSLLCRSGRYGLLVFGLLGLFTSMHLACTFSDEPPTSSKKKSSPVTDSGSITDSGPIVGDDGGTSSGGTNAGYGYTYGYGADGCYGYGYGYTPTYAGTSVCD